MSTSTPTSVEFWFDPICPWTYITSRWAASVADQRGVTIRWQPFSLQVLNEGVDTGSHGSYHAAGHALGRVVTAVSAVSDYEAVDALYRELGQRLFIDERSDYPEIVTESLAAAGLAAAFATAYGDEQYDAALRESTQRGRDLVGPGVGIPIISFDGNAFFGPVISPAPTGDDALKLWDAVVAAAAVPGFYELKRGREVGPQFG